VCPSYGWPGWRVTREERGREKQTGKRHRSCAKLVLDLFSRVLTSVVVTAMFGVWRVPCVRGSHLPGETLPTPGGGGLGADRAVGILLCLLCVTLLVSSSYSSFVPPSPFLSSSWQRDWESFIGTIVLRGSLLTRDVCPRRSKYLLIVELDHSVMRFAYALHTCATRILSLFPACTLRLSRLL